MPEMQDPMDGEPEDAVKDEQAEDVETSQSEIVETHVLPEDSEPDEMNAQVKRPRRRRRRRRRKRPKPTASPEELEAYYTVPEEEIKHKPTKYQPPEETEEPLPESSTKPRRRNAKRRRRPIKRPPVVEDYPGTAEGFADNANGTDESQPPEQLPVEEHPEDVLKFTKPHVIEVVETEPPPPSKPQLPIVTKKVQVKKENEPLYPIFKDGPKLLHPKESDFTKPPVRDDTARKPQESIIDDVVDANEYAKFESASKTKTKEVPAPEIRKEVEPPREDQTVNVRRRKRPPFKSEPAEPSKPEQLEPKVAESVDTKNQVQAIRKNEVKIDDEAKINLVEQRKFKIDERVKQNNDTKKDAFKLRRLPPISAILRHAKNRPKNETSTVKPPAKNDSSKIKESITNEILTHAATLDQIDQRIANETEEEEQVAVAVPSTSTARVDKTEKPTTSTTRSTHKTNHFEFPIIAYTEQKHRQTTVAPTTAAPVTTTTSTTESTAFIYIPCNNTITEVFRNTFNFSNRENASQHADPVRTTELVTEPQTSSTTEYNDNKHLFDASAIKQLEKLLQTEVETVSATVENVNQTKEKNTTQVNTLLQQLDANALESELNYLFQNGVTSTQTHRDVKSSTEQNFREPKWFVDPSKHRHQNLKDEKGVASEKPNNFNYDKEIIISYTSTIFPTSFNDVDPQEVFHGNELSLQLRNNSYRRMTPDSMLHKNKNYSERKKLPLAVKSAIIISGAILALAVLGFFALLLSCKIRQAKSRMKCHRELYRERFQNSEFRQSSRSTSPVVSKSNYNTRNFPNNIQTNVASNRNYYLWQTLRKTFQYD